MPFTSAPNSVIDNYLNNKLVQRRYYGRTGKPRLDIDLTDHGNPNEHNVVPHYHEWNEFVGGKLKRDTEHNRELEMWHKIANTDIIKKGVKI